MITFLQAMAILSVLSAFGVDSTTISKVHDILIPPVVSVATTTPQVSQTPFVPIPVVQTPVVQDKPIYFGSTNPSVQSSTTPSQSSSATTTVTTVPVVQQKPFIVQNAEMSYSTFSKQYVLRVFANIPISIASTTGMGSITIGTPTVDNAQSGYTPYWSEAPLFGVPPQVFEYPNLQDADHPHGKGGEARSYQITIYSQDGQTSERGVSVPYP